MDLDFLSQHVDFTPEELEIIREYFHEQIINKNDLFLKEGDICTSVAYIRNGTLILSQVNDNGNEQVLDFFSTGDLVSDYVSFLKNSPADTSIRALKNSKLLIITKNDLHHLYETMPNFQKLGRLLAEKYFLVFAHKLKTVSLPPLIRYEQLISQKPNIFDEVPQYLIASYLGISPEWLSKIRSQK